MLTAYAKDPRPSHSLNVVDNSTHVKRESQFKAIYPHALVNSSRIAMDDSTDGLDALREFDEAPFAVTLGDRQVMVEAIHPIQPEFLIAVRCTDTRGADAITIN